MSLLQKTIVYHSNNKGQITTELLGVETEPSIDRELLSSNTAKCCQEIREVTAPGFVLIFSKKLYLMFN